MQDREVHFSKEFGDIWHLLVKIEARMAMLNIDGDEVLRQRMDDLISRLRELNLIHQKAHTPDMPILLG